MLTQEEYVQRVLELKRQGFTVTEIAAEVGYHPATVSKWLKLGGPPPKRRVNPAERVVDGRWAGRIDELIAPPSKLLSTSVFEIICVEGFTGSYPSVVRHVRARRGPRFRVAPQVSVPIETGPGEESQFDFSDCSARGRQFGLGDTLWCFGAVLCWSRYLCWWFTTSVDRQHTTEGLVRHFEEAGGVPQVARTDRMGALGTSQGRRFVLHPPTLDFASHHGTEIKACQARDAKRKGKIERPFRGLEASFLEELAVLGPPATITELNVVAASWLADRVNGRVHSVTGCVPAERLVTERRFLSPLPRRRYDTAYAEPRRVHLAVPLVHWKGVRYSVTPACIGQRVACREEVDAGELTITWAAQVVGRHPVAPAGSCEVWDPSHRQAAEAAALGRTRPALRLVTEAAPVPRPGDPYAGYDVTVPDLADRYGALS
jgi:transposase